MFDDGDGLQVHHLLLWLFIMNRESSGESEVCGQGLVPQRLQDVWKAQEHAHFLRRPPLVPRPKTRQM
jgi:hypothetical protein